MSPDREGVTDDAALGGRLRLLQPQRGHRFGHDAILLAAAVEARPGDHVVEFGAGVGAAGLAVAARVPGIRLTLVEIDPVLANLARENCARNTVAAGARVICLDAGATPDAFAAAGLSPASADHVLMNPPFHDARSSAASPDPARRAAHLGGPAMLAAWIASAAGLMAPTATVTVIYRADATTDIVSALSRVGAVTIRPIQSKPDAAPIRIIARATRGFSAPASQLRALLLNDEYGRPAAGAEEILREGKALGWA
jgi:tRNA1(Val) A37 N6-methylase TrmN6